MLASIQKYTKWVTNPEWVFLSLVIPFGILSALLVPQLSVNDENNHFLRAYNLATGSLGNHHCTFPAEITEKSEATYKKIYTAAYEEEINASRNQKARCGSAATYSPFMHLPQAIGIFLANLIHPSTGLMVLLGRLANLAFYATALYFIVKHVRIGKWVFVVVGLFPLSVHLAASLSADVMNNVVVLCFFALLFNLFTQTKRITRKQALFLVVLTGLLALTKLTNIVFMLPLVFLPVALFEKNSVKNVPFNIRKWVLGLGCLVACIAGVVLWQRIFGGSLVSVHTPPPVNPLDDNPFHFLTILYTTYFNPFIGYTDGILRGVIGEFSSYQYHVPLFILILHFFLLLIVLLRANKQEEQTAKPVVLQLGLACVGSIVLLVLAVTYAMYTTWAIQPFRLGPAALYADGVQGRYFTAALVAFVPIFIWFRRFLKFEVSSQITLGLLVLTLNGGSLLYYILETYKFIT